MFLIIVICLSALAETSMAQVLGLKYPDYTLMSNFDVSKYMGRWYEISRFASLHEMYSSCSTVDYTLNANGTFDIKVRAVHQITGANVHWQSLGTPESQNEKSKIHVSLPANVPQQKTMLYILYSDYENFSVVSVIQDMANPPNNLQFIWILSRKPTLDRKYYSEALDILHDNHVRSIGLENVEQDNCPEDY